MTDNTDGLTVREVSTRQELDDFILFQQTLYRDDPNWVCPLYFEQK